VSTIPVNTTTIRTEGLSRRYGKAYVVRNVDLAIAAGECVALVGHNGAGKSTLIKMALGLLQPSEGRVELLGEDPAGHRGVAFRRGIGFLPENVAFAPAMTGREVLAFYVRLKQLPAASGDPLLERFGLAAAARRRVGTYSKGMRQRLGLAQALLGAPRVLFLDEPTTGLDPESRRMVYGIVSELRDAGATVLLSSHALTEIGEKADRIAVMKQGHLVACGTMAELRRLADLPVRIRVQLPAGQGLGYRDHAADPGRSLRPADAGGGGMSAIATIAAREIRDGLRNRWVLGAALLMAGLALTLSFLGSAPTGEVGAGPLEVTIVSLSSLTIFLVPLIALLLSHDAIVGEQDRGTLLLLLSYPVARWQVVLGKFLGHIAILGFATALGYGAAAAALAIGGAGVDREGLLAFAGMIGSSILLGAVFVALGYLVSVIVRERATAAGLAIGIWLAFVLLYDMALLGLLVADQGRTIGAAAFNWLLLANPADVYRLLNLAGLSKASMFAGMAGLTGQMQFARGVLFLALAAWVAAPLSLATLVFSRRQM
jgi:Cu-processing system permease protein